MMGRGHAPTTTVSEAISFSLTYTHPPLPYPTHPFSSYSSSFYLRSLCLSKKKKKKQPAAIDDNRSCPGTQEQKVRISDFEEEEEEAKKVRDGNLPMIMEVLVGPTYGMEVSAASPSPSYARDRNGVPPAPVQGKAVISSSSASASSSCLFMNGLEDVVGELHEETQNGSSESSIGSPGDSDDEQENDEVSSSKGEHELRRNSNLSLDSLDDSLPIKRGLSNHYSGKSKSFGNLAEASSVKDLEKVENPFNKRRRLLIANKLSKKFFYSRLNPKSMPLLPFINDNDEKTDDEEDGGGGGGHNTEASYTDHRLQERLEVKDPTTTTAWRQQNQSRLKICSKSMSCFALGDLIEEEDEED